MCIWKVTLNSTRKQTTQHTLAAARYLWKINICCSSSLTYVYLKNRKSKYDNIVIIHLFLLWYITSIAMTWKDIVHLLEHTWKWNYFFFPRKIFLFKINFKKLYTSREVWNVLQSQSAQFLVSAHSSHLNNDKRNLHSIAASELGTAMQIESNSWCSLLLYLLLWKTGTHISICHPKWCLNFHSVLLNSLHSKFCDNSLYETMVLLNIFPITHLLQADTVYRSKRCKKWNTQFLYVFNTTSAEIMKVALKNLGHFTHFL